MEVLHDLVGDTTSLRHRIGILNLVRVVVPDTIIDRPDQKEFPLPGRRCPESVLLAAGTDVLIHVVSTGYGTTFNCRIDCPLGLNLHGSGGTTTCGTRVFPVSS